MTAALYPRLVEMWGKRGFTIYIAGRSDLPPFARKALADRPEFEHLGFVMDLDALMARCHAVIAPIDVPVGNRSRIVTAMSRGALLVAHKNMALTNPDLIHGENCFLADRPEDFAQWMQRAFEEPEAATAIRTQARISYRTRFHPEVASELLVVEVARVLHGGV
jgi:glycosyltransferase involved in cell wall biosynthesis